MNEKQLMIIALISSLVGILIILLASELTEIPLIKISEINENQVGKEVRVIATISSVQSTPGLYILTLKENSSEIKAIIFKENNLDFEKDVKVEIIGEVVKYKNILEIQVSQLKKL